MCTCNNNSSCSCGSLITTSKGNTGPTGATGATGATGPAGEDGVINWTDFDIDCWVSQNITEGDATNDEITQDFIDAFCNVYQKVNTAISAVDDYAYTDKNVTVNINPTTNDFYFPTVTVTIDSDTNGTATVDVDNHTVIFVPTTDFVGTGIVEYTITDTNSNSASAKIYIEVRDTPTTEEIEDTVLTTLITLLSSNEYWDLGLPIGTKLLISNENLGDFSTTGITAGKGLPDTKWEKWAICNGNMTNGVDDLRLRNLRGFDYADGDGNDVAGFHAGSDTVTLAKANIPAHVHTYDDNEFYDAGSSNGDVDDAAVVGDWKNRTNASTTGNGTADGLQTSPDAVDVTNAYATVIVVQKIA